MSKPYELEEVDRIPPSGRPVGLYDRMMNDFLEGSKRRVLVKAKGKSAEAIYQGMRNCIVNRNLENVVGCFLRLDKVYLSKLSQER